MSTAEKLAEALDRVKFEAVSLADAQVIALEALAEYRAQPAASQAEMVCAEAYQVVGSLLSDVGQFDTELGGKILDNLSQARMVHNDVLPWPSFEPAADGAQRVDRMSEEQIDRIVDAVDSSLDGSGSDFRAFVRAIETHLAAAWGVKLDGEA